MIVKIPDIETFPNVAPDKAQALKVLEEAAEVFGAWQMVDSMERSFEDVDEHSAKRMIDLKTSLIDECADVIQATSNLLASIGVDDMSDPMARCAERNESRGRYQEK